MIAPLVAWVAIPALALGRAFQVSRRGRVTIREGFLSGFVLMAAIVAALALDGKTNAGATIAGAFTFGLGGGALFALLLLYSKYSGRSKIEISW